MSTTTHPRHPAEPQEIFRGEVKPAAPGLRARDSAGSEQGEPARAEGDPGSLAVVFFPPCSERTGRQGQQGAQAGGQCLVMASHAHSAGLRALNAQARPPRSVSPRGQNGVPGREGVRPRPAGREAAGRGRHPSASAARLWPRAGVGGWNPEPRVAAWSTWALGARATHG